jgi:hypothetical protein
MYFVSDLDSETSVRGLTIQEQSTPTPVNYPIYKIKYLTAYLRWVIVGFFEFIFIGIIKLSLCSSFYFRISKL